jgi:hypothetical protein
LGARVHNLLILAYTCGTSSLFYFQRPDRSNVTIIADSSRVSFVFTGSPSGQLDLSIADYIIIIKNTNVKKIKKQLGVIIMRTIMALAINTDNTCSGTHITQGLIIIPSNYCTTIN